MKSFMRSAAVLLSVACLALFMAKAVAEDEGGEQPKKKKGASPVEMTGMVKVIKGEDGKVTAIHVTEEGKEAVEVTVNEKTATSVANCDGKKCKVTARKGKDGKMALVKCEAAAE